MSSMMKIDPTNPIVHQCLKTFLMKADKIGSETFYDYDNCQYNVERTEEEPEIVKLGFSCNCYDQIMANGGQEMLNELYKDNQLPENRQIPNTNITLAIKVADSGKT